MNPFLHKFTPLKISETKEFSSSWIAPSNIAFIKYWGKVGTDQIAMNSSLSMTLKNSLTKSTFKWVKAQCFSYNLTVKGMDKHKVTPKLNLFLSLVRSHFDFLDKYHLEIESENTFPHSTGIASSASSYASFALNIMDFIYYLSGLEIDEKFYQSASFLARLGSGSACRSVYGGLVAWDQPHFARPLTEIDQSKLFLNDLILILNSKEKSVSSTLGHSLMSNHPYRSSRINQAQDNYTLLLQSLGDQNLNFFGEIIESEALSLHALMWMSSPSYNLLLPDTLRWIEALRLWRKQEGYPVYFTLDAGPNLHLIYPKDVNDKVCQWINKVDIPFEKFLEDEIGDGPKNVKYISS